MPSSFGVFDQTDLLPRNSFKDSRLCLGSLAGVQPPQEPRSNLKLYAENERLEPENHPIEKEHSSSIPPFLGVPPFYFPESVDDIFALWYFWTLSKRWPGVCNNSVSESEQWRDSSMSTFRYLKDIESSPKTSLDLLLVASLSKHVQKKKRRNG